MISPIPLTLLDSFSGKSNSIPGTVKYTDLEVDSLLNRVIEENDYEAFKVLFRKMYAPLCGFCIRFVHVREVAEELVSDVFYTIWKNRERINMTSPKAYLFTSVRNRGFDYLRKAKRSVLCNLEQATHIQADLPDSEAMLEHQELSCMLQQSIAKLPKQCRLIFEMSREQGLKYREIATHLNISVKTVETQMGRALKHLRQVIPVL